MFVDRAEGISNIESVVVIKQVGRVRARISV